MQMEALGNNKRVLALCRLRIYEFIPRPSAFSQDATPSKGNIMRPIAKLAFALAASCLVFTSQGFAQQSGFDSKKFFEELQTRGYSVPSTFDGKKFFEDLQTRGYSDKKKLDAKAFFEELRIRGVSGPASFDAKKFFEDMSKQAGGKMPDMVEMPQ
jgi:hypothetical protein